MSSVVSNLCAPNDDIYIHIRHIYIGDRATVFKTIAIHLQGFGEEDDVMRKRLWVRLLIESKYGRAKNVKKTFLLCRMMMQANRNNFQLND